LATIGQQTGNLRNEISITSHGKNLAAVWLPAGYAEAGDQDGAKTDGNDC